MRISILIFQALPICFVAGSRTTSSSVLLLPRDIAYDSVARMALQSLRSSPDTVALFQHQLFGQDLPFSGSYDQNSDASTSIDSINSNSTADYNCLGTLTLVGAKGGQPVEQTNQDRSFVWISNTDIEEGQSSPGVTTISGVLDGHGGTGHFVAEHARYTLLEELKQAITSSRESSLDWPAELQKAFRHADTTLPPEQAQHGGCTCSIVVQTPTQLVFANAGDSQSFLVGVVLASPSDASNDANENEQSSTNIRKVQVIYATRLDTPNDPSEAERLRAAGAIVTAETARDIARVWNADQTSGVAMSRGLGDWSHSAVISEPVVQAIDLDHWRETLLQDEKACETSVEADGSSSMNNACASDQSVQFFVVSATDGVMDFLEPAIIAEHLAAHLYGDQGHVLTAMEELMLQSTNAWHRQGKYRDDMAIAVTRVFR